MAGARRRLPRGQYPRAEMAQPASACSRASTDAGGGSTVPGYGDARTARRQLFTFSESHVFGPRVVNEARLGFNRIHIIFDPIPRVILEHF